jgi:predicted dehydrogenase
MKSEGRRKIRYAVAGLGHLAQVAVLPAFKQRANSELVALISGDPKKQTKVSKKYGVDHVYSYDQYEECLSQGVDAVYIVLPNHLHRDFTVRALNAGVHVLCEKPMAVTKEDCEAMIGAAEKNDRKLMIAYRLHFEKGNLEAIGIARRGKLGDLRFFTSEFAQQVVKDNIRLSERVEAGGGPVYDMGVYCINAARYLFGAEPTHVFASSASKDEPRFQNAEEMTTAVLKFPGDRLATFTVSFGAADISRYTLVGTKGILSADPAYEYAEGINLQVRTGQKSRTRNFSKRDQFAAEIKYFSDCILKDKDPEPSGLEGFADVRVVEAIYQSANAQQVVALPPFPEKRWPTLNQEIHRRAHGKPKTINTASPSGEAA